MNLAVVLNPAARALRRDRRLPDRLRKLLLPGDTLQMPGGLDALADWAHSAHAQGCSQVAVVGGDGTVHQVFTAIRRAWGDAPLPEVMLLHGGTMNTVSASMGQRGRPEAQLRSWQDERRGGQRLQRTRRWPLVVDEQRTGFLFGIGIVPRFIEVYDSGAEPSPVKAALTLARAVGSAFTGGPFAAEFFRGIPAEVTADGKPWPSRAWMILTAGAVQHIGLDFQPFPGVLTHPGHMHVFGSASSPMGFAKDLFPLRLGKPARHPAAHDQVCQTLRIESTEELVYNLDGDLYRTTGEVQVRSGPAWHFVLARGARPPENTLGP